MRLSALPLAALLVLLAAVLPGLAAADDGLDQRAREIERALKCPVCQNLSVADSSSELAGQMRDLIRKKLAAGESREEILAYFVERYGEDVLLDPPRAGFGGLVWWGALAIPIVGLAVVAAYLRGRRAGARPAGATEAGLTEADLLRYEPILERELERATGGEKW